MELNEFFRDEQKVQEGTWISELSGFDADLKLKVRGLTSKDYMNHMARRQRIAPQKDRESDRSLKVDAMRKIMADLLPEYILLDWEGITNNGEPVPYDKEQVKEWLRQASALPLMNAILEAAQRVDEMTKGEKEIAVKN